MAGGRTWRQRRSKKLKQKQNYPENKIERVKGRLITPSDDINCINLSRWIKLKDTHTARMAPAVFKKTGRGLMALENIYPGSSLIRLPLDLLVDESTVNRSSIGRLIENYKINGITVKDKFCIFLAFEFRCFENSDWVNYFQSLPDDFTTPNYLDKIYHNLLPPDLLVDVLSRNEELFSSHNRINQALNELNILCKQNLKLLSLNEVQWALNVINTRSVYFDKTVKLSNNRFSGYSKFALAPFLDFLNHSPSAKIKAGYCHAKRCFEIITFDQYKKGDEVFISYGDHDNQLLFGEYGFCIPNHTLDTVTVTVEEVCDAAQIHLQDADAFKVGMALCKKLGLDKLDFSFDYSGLSWTLDAVLSIVILHKFNPTLTINMVVTSNQLNLKQKTIFDTIILDLIQVKKKLIIDYIKSISKALEYCEQTQKIILSNVVIMLKSQIRILDNYINQ